MKSEGNKVYQPVSFDKEGHRGCRGLMPENTIPAMLEAVGMNATTLEMDVVITKDGKVVLSHEPFFNHEITTKADGSFVKVAEEKSYNIYRMDYADVIKFDVGLKPHPRFPEQKKMAAVKPLLSDVFAAVKQDMVTRRRPFPYYNIETKTMPATDGIFHPAPAEFVEKLMAVINDAGVSENVIVQSFDFRTLQYLHKKYPAIRTAMLIEKTDGRSLRKQIADLGFNPTIYSPDAALVTTNLISECHEKNILVIPWTVDEPSEIKRLKAMGVDGLISDYPDRL